MRGISSAVDGTNCDCQFIRGAKRKLQFQGKFFGELLFARKLVGAATYSITKPVLFLECNCMESICLLIKIITTQDLLLKNSLFCQILRYRCEFASLVIDN